MNDSQTNKIEAIFELREAVEHKVHAEISLEQNNTAEARYVLLDAALEVESKTQAAIEVCHECDNPHPKNKDDNTDCSNACEAGGAKVMQANGKPEEA